MNYSEDQIKDLIRCRDDIEYFANTHIKISESRGVGKIQLTDFQKEVIRKYQHDRVFFLPSGRMAGKTTVAAIILLHQSIYHNDRVSMIMAPKKWNSNYIIELMTEMFDRLPQHIAGVKMVTRNKSKIEFDNGCAVISAGSEVNYGRGRALSNIYIDESEFVDCSDILDFLWPCMAGIPYAKIFALSSTKTEDLFRMFSRRSTS
jgi:hypothetical protein